MLSEKEVSRYIGGAGGSGVKRHFTIAEAHHIGGVLGIPWDRFDVEQFRQGLTIELEHGRCDPATDVTHDDAIATGKIALAHLLGIPDYYTRLAAMGQGAEREKNAHQGGGL